MFSSSEILVINSIRGGKVGSCSAHVKPKRPGGEAGGGRECGAPTINF